MDPCYEKNGVTLYHGDCRQVLAQLPDSSVQTCITSPPYYGLRDYGAAGQLGLEDTPVAYVAALVETFRQVRRVLRDDGTLWLNLGDSYAVRWSSRRDKGRAGFGSQDRERPTCPGTFWAAQGVKEKDLLGIPWRVAFALQADGWCLRSDVIWHKPNPIPENVRDRPTKAHEYLFLLAKSKRYYCDMKVAQVPSKRAGSIPGGNRKVDASRNDAGRDMTIPVADMRNRHSVWTIATKPFAQAHFATFPPKLVEPCILAGCPQGSTVIDPFIGSGTTALVARQHGRRCVGIDLNVDYLELARARLCAVTERSRVTKPR